MIKRIFFVVLGCCATLPVNAGFDESNHLHHFFNARLLQPGEAQVSLVGNAKLGLTPTFEVGTQLAGLLFIEPTPYNLALKHKMFAGDSYQTSFNMHAGVVSLESDTTENLYTLSLHGIVTTMNLSSSQFLNWGFWDLYIRNDDQDSGNELRSHLLAPMVGYDIYLGNSLALSAVAVQPVYGYTQSNTDVGDAISEIDFLKSHSQALQVLFLTGTMAFGDSYVEAGVVGLGGQWSLYANVFWRFDVW